jgi:hypothetical protein
MAKRHHVSGSIDSIPLFKTLFHLQDKGSHETPTSSYLTMSLPFSQLSDVAPEESISQVNFDGNIDEEKNIHGGKGRQSTPVAVDMGPVRNGLNGSPAYFIVTKDTLAEGQAFLKVSTYSKHKLTGRALGLHSCFDFKARRHGRRLDPGTASMNVFIAELANRILFVYTAVGQKLTHGG